MSNAAGGTRNPLVVTWPKGITKKGEVRTQYAHLIDLLPTTLEMVGATVPAEVAGIKQTPIQGKSLVYSFADAAAPSKRTTQYYHLYGSGAIYHDGWKASSHPAKLAEMKALFDQEARAKNVYPLINWSDLSIGITEFQRKSGLLPPATASKK